MVYLTNTNMCMIKAMMEAYRMVPELAIPEDVEENEQVYKLAIGLHEACAKLDKIQLELGLQIVDLQLKSKPSILLNVKEQCATVATEAIAEVNSAVLNCTQLFEQSFEVLMSLQEDANVQQLEMET